MRSLVRIAGCAIALSLLAACGGEKPEQAVVDACLRAAEEKLADNDAEIDVESMLAAVTRKDDGTWEVGGDVYFERGMQGERKQTITCQARNGADGKGAPEVTLLQFLW